jgi:hypothetical protein
MSKRAASHKSSLINRTGEGGGSIGGNFKQGIVQFSKYPNINIGHLTSRTTTGKCCIDADYTQDNNDSIGDPANPTNPVGSTDPVEPVIPVIPVIPVVPIFNGPAPTWEHTVTDVHGSSVTYRSDGSITFQGDVTDLLLSHPSPASFMPS